MKEQQKERRQKPADGYGACAKRIVNGSNFKAIYLFDFKSRLNWKNDKTGFETFAMVNQGTDEGWINLNILKAV
nr:hypothetical protein [Tanacetum cinerariifolium]